MTSDEQLDEWVKGNSIHNDDREECCPDFSCCQTHFKATLEERILFRDRPELRDNMLMNFLGAAMAGYDPDKKVHIAGSTEGSA